MSLNIDKIRADFPILSQKVNDHNLIYFDNAATTQKPKVMIDELTHYYTEINSNIHRGVHTLSQKATEAFDSTRQLIAQTYGVDFRQVIFTKNDTEAINIIAWGLRNLIKDGNVVVTESEHHSNIVPWQISLDSLATNSDLVKVGTDRLRFAEINSQGFIDLDSLQSKIDSNTKVLSFAWASNTFGVENNIQEIVKIARLINPGIIIVVDAAQIVGHQLFDFSKLDIDFVTFSAHKMYGPTGVGVLIGRSDILEKMPPLFGGGDMIKEVDYEETSFNEIPYKFEAGTPNIADVIAFKKSLEYLLDLGFDNIRVYESELAHYLLEKLSELNFIELYGAKSKEIPLALFNVKNVHAHDVGTILDQEGIAVRSGHHCSQIVMKKLNIPASVRVSLSFYNTKEEVDRLIEGLKKVLEVFK